MSALQRLHTLRSRGRARKKKRVGRGNASGKGTYSGRGRKGQHARSGKGKEKMQRLGMRHIIQSIPKKRGGFGQYKKRVVSVVALRDLERVFAKEAQVTPETLMHAGLIRHTRGVVKIIGDAVITKPLIIRGCALSKGAREKVEKGGGKVFYKNT